MQAFALPENSADAALIVQLPPGNYTFQVAGKGSATGTVLGAASSEQQTLTGGANRNP